ncbi:MAG: hypothetical protein A2381_19250 [Bdellovibrionales bacterium RIFOXYB1_FULL_37_110]|nr:MAG: hypothetical protein A2181_00175 [Bdellovibrionales bacterium RIFOXYA1_FULL_38_20]OFZ49515.1 MAG: hypothetical protein A2417_04400 [Bdellovibrionales bacterium RIFOXYC1_FULL_37_79]OFZ58669.1 MAG: hypothetical protein A2381_19250 [Bdellovibrionales bacterium RIFOXYB1_FULL_37_110]OFZ63213.1 MAG: hypothetical protein A2577_16835 [Bdellovibrionales bacterium RIFOXYD1_FULL_36_51]
MLAQTLRAHLDNTWKCRFERDKGRTFECFVKLKQSMNAYESSDYKKVYVDVKRKFGKPMALEYLTIWGSVKRLMGKQSESLEIFNLIDELKDDESIKNNFYIYFEQGIQMLIKGAFEKAFEYFILSKELAPADNLKVAASLNELIALDNIGANISGSIEKIKQLMINLKDQDLGMVIKTTLKNLEAKHQFRAGDFSEILSGEFQSQGKYIKYFVQSLPYQKEVTVPESINLFQMANASDLHLSDYRFRTLSGKLNQDDFLQYQISDWSDRFYLWTWFFLKEPYRFSFLRISDFVSSFNWKMISQMTAEDQAMVLNSMLWIGLFSHQDYHAIIRKFYKYSSYNKEQIYTLFDFEKNIIQYFFALRDKRMDLAGDMLEGLKKHSLFTSNAINLSDLLKDTLEIDHPLFFLHQQLSKFKGIDYLDNYTYVDITKGQIIKSYKKRQTVINSRYYAVALNEFVSREVVKKNDFIHAVFGIYSYDPIIHDSKLKTLLSRIRKDLGISLNIKDDNIFLNTTTRLVCLDMPVYCKEIKNARALFSATGVTKSKGSKDKNDPLDKNVKDLGLEDKWLSRNELQKYLDKSRSTTNRLINEWLNEKMLIKKGTFRNAQYLLGKVLLEKMKRGVL